MRDGIWFVQPVFLSSITFAFATRFRAKKTVFLIGYFIIITLLFLILDWSILVLFRESVLNRNGFYFHILCLW